MIKFIEQMAAILDMECNVTKRDNIYIVDFISTKDMRRYMWSGDLQDIAKKIVHFKRKELSPFSVYKPVYNKHLA